jgi:hypothetical protein
MSEVRDGSLVYRLDRQRASYNLEPPRAKAGNWTVNRDQAAVGDLRDGNRESFACGRRDARRYQKQRTSASAWARRKLARSAFACSVERNMEPIWPVAWLKLATVSAAT